MTRVYAGLGSNVDKEENIPAGLNTLASHFSPLAISTVYENEPLGFNGENFYNLVVGFDTDLSALEVISIFKSIESSLGRQPASQNASSKTISHTLDIDLLLFGDLVRHNEQIDIPRQDIVQYPFVLCPLAELAGDLEHPETGLSIVDMWASFDKDRHQLKPVTL
jgi:2-amino-4-hydroxy-6-hydroxymethyldihydropteridine diphosphokinase